MNDTFTSVFSSICNWTCAWYRFCWVVIPGLGNFIIGISTITQLPKCQWKSSKNIQKEEYLTRFVDLNTIKTEENKSNCRHVSNENQSISSNTIFIFLSDIPFYSKHRTRARQWCISLSLTVPGVVLWPSGAAPTVAPVKLFHSSKCSHALHLPIFVITASLALELVHDDIIKWKYFPRYWPFVRGIHRSPASQ